MTGHGSLDTGRMAGEKIRKAAAALSERLVAFRRDFHQFPEIGFEERRTAGIIAGRLRELGLDDVKTGVAHTGVVGLLRGRGTPAESGAEAAERSGRTVALRADMDALPIEEATGAPYASKQPRRMHACGHDAHAAMLLGAAEVLAGLRDWLPGNVKFIFQPAEEGPGGAEVMIREGVLRDPPVDAIAMIHVYPNIPTGEAGIRSGPACAAVDTFYLKIIGQGGHGASPHLAVDSIAVAAQVISTLQTIVSREVPPVQPAVITVGTIEGGYRHNIIAPEVRLSGTVRTFDPELRRSMPERIRRIVGGVTAAMRAEFELDYEDGYPAQYNDAALTGLLQSSAEAVLGPGRVHEIVHPTMGAEDFAYFCREIPGTSLRLGAGNPDKGCVNMLHHPKFDLDEDALPLGTAILAQFAWDFLAKP